MHKPLSLNPDEESDVACHSCLPALNSLKHIWKHKRKTEHLSKLPLKPCLFLSNFSTAKWFFILTLLSRKAALEQDLTSSSLSPLSHSSLIKMVYSLLLSAILLPTQSLKLPWEKSKGSWVGEMLFRGRHES